MYPILLQLGGVNFYTYGFVMMSSLFLIYFLVTRNLDETLMNQGHVSDISFLVVFSIWFGGGLISLALTGEFTLNIQKLQNVGTMGIGSAFMLSLFGYCAWKRLPFIKIMDFFMPYFILGYGLQRSFGCFSAGCCHGRPTTLPWGVRFGDTMGVGPSPGVSVHPTQLYMGIAALLTCLLMVGMRQRLQKSSGAMTGCGMTLLFGVYFLVTFYRNDLDQQPLYLGYDLNQIFSFALFVCGLLIWLGTTIWHKREQK